MLVAVQLSVLGSYLPPVFNSLPSNPPHTIISLPVHTAVCHARPEGALTVLVAVQLSVMGLYLPPVLPLPRHPRRSFHCRSTPPCDRIGHWARWSCWWLSSYPCWDCISRRCSKRGNSPPQTIISLPVHTAVCSYRPVGALMVLVAAQLSTHPLGPSDILGNV